ncbi:MAG: inositol-3-phosphate synthase, partial [Pirellulales bacterium]
MAKGRIGLWLIGAKGGVATTVMTGLTALGRGLVEPIGLITETEAFHSLSLIDWGDVVIGGHDIRNASLLDEARRMWTVSRAIPPGVLEAVAPDLIDIETRLRPGTVLASGTSIQAIASLPESKSAKTPRSIIDQIRTDILD